MLTPEQITALRDAAGRIADPINAYLLDDIARRIAEAGQITSTASYEVWRAQQLGMSQREIKKQLRKLLRVSHRDLRQLLTQSAEVGYNFDIKNLPQVQAVPFGQNAAMQQIVSAAVQLAQDDFTNITQTLGMTDPHGNALPLQDVYRACCDFAFKQVSTGATDYNTSVRQACKNLAEKGVLRIDYESGVHTSLEAAVRRSVMGGLGLMQEQITQQNHDDLDCDGWEISAHAASAPDHEPIQGNQYSDAEYTALNNSLVRRIGTLNCGHSAFPIILGVSRPQYTPKELQKFREDNDSGIDYQGKHYTLYEATQMQRRIEASMRRKKRRILVDDATGDKEKLQTDQIRYVRLKDEYARFSNAAGLHTQVERAEVSGFGPKQGRAAKKMVANTSKSDIIVPEGDMLTVDIEIDRFTPCLYDVNSGENINTEYSLASQQELSGLRKKGWLFNWRDKSLKNSDVYKLTLQGNNTIQGLVAIEKQERNTAYHLSLAESAPHNKGIMKQYEGVGGHLFAIAAQKSVESGFGGFIYFEAKNRELVRHYEDAFGAHLIGMPHEYSMVIDEESAQKLLQAYTLEGGD